MSEPVTSAGGSGGELVAGQQFGPYRVERRFGAGGMSVLYEATEVALERPIALKVMAGTLSADATFRDRFVGEARAASAIEHPNVIPIFAAGEVDDRLYIAMRLVPGGFDLRKLLRQEGRLGPARAAALLSQAASALDVCHARGLVHRDVKPDNLLLSPDEEAPGVPHLYLIDFGLTRAPAQARLTRAGQVLGTLAYAPPEQIRGEEIDGRADVYALGITLFECLAGRRPFVRSNDAALLYAQINDEPPSLREHCPELPPDVDAVLGCALAKDRTERYGSCAELLMAFCDASATVVPRQLEARPVSTPAFEDASTIVRDAGSGPSPVDEDALTRPARRSVDERGPATTRRAWPLRVGAAALVLLVVAGIAVAVTHRGSDGSFHLKRLTSANGLTVDRSWQLAGSNGDRFEAATEIANPSDHQVTYTHDEVFPKSLAADAGQITSDPPPDRIVVVDPVLRWKREVPADGSLVLHFTIAVAPEGVSDDRLQSWVDDRRRAESAYAKTPAARESDTPFEDDDGVEVAAPGIGSTQAPNGTTDATESPPDGRSDTSVSTEPRRAPDSTPPTISTTKPSASSSTSSTAYKPPTVTVAPPKTPYTPAATPQPTQNEQNIIDRVNGFGGPHLTTDGRLTRVARDAATSNAANRAMVNPDPFTVTTGQDGEQSYVQRGSDLEDVWATSTHTSQLESIATGSGYQFIGVGVVNGTDGMVYIVISFMRVR